MQIIEANVDGLKRTLKVVVGAAEIEQRLASRLDQVKDNVQIKGFRKGKVPVAHIKKVYGRSLMTEVLQDAIRETSDAAIRDRKERPAQMPNISLSEDQDEINGVIEGKNDLAYQMTFEVVPEIALADFETIELERLAADVDDETLQKSIETATAADGPHAYAVGVNPQAAPVYPQNVRPFPGRENCDYNEQGFTCKVPAGHYFMMGDNRDNSDDSRYWGFVPDDHIRGKAFFIWFNWDDISNLAFKRVGSGIR